jgi:hypothetical protein
MTPFALAHLSVSWTCLTSLRLSVPAPSQAAAGADSVSADCAARQLFMALESFTCLKHLTLTLAGGCVAQGEPLEGGRLARAFVAWHPARWR